MRILMTSILCHTGLMTHVYDLADYLRGKGLFVAIAYKRVNYLSIDAKEKLLAKHSDIPYLFYDTRQELEKFGEDMNCDLMHAHSHTTFDAASAISEALNIPLVITLHSVFPWQRIFSSALQAADKIVAVGPAQALSAPKFATKIEVIPNGIDLQKFVPSTEPIADKGSINILWYGRVDGRLSRGLSALDRLVPLLPQNIEIRALGSADFIPRNIKLKPWTNNPLRDLQETQITFGQSRSLREAMACGSIGMLLASGYGGLVTEEWLKQGRAVDAFPEYRLVRPRPRVLLQDILTLVNQPHIGELRQEARRLAEKYFSIEDMGRKTLDIYEMVLA